MQAGSKEIRNVRSVRRNLTGRERAIAYRRIGSMLEVRKPAADDGRAEAAVTAVPDPGYASSTVAGRAE